MEKAISARKCCLYNLELKDQELTYPGGEEASVNSSKQILFWVPVGAISKSGNRKEKRKS